MKETDRVIQHNFQNIKDKHKWMIDLDSAAYAEMSCMETQHPISEIEASRAKDKFVAKRARGKTTSSCEYCKMDGDRVLIDNIMEGDGA